MMNFKKIMGIICLISIIPYSVMASLRSDVQKILKNEFPVSYKFVQHKWFPDHKLLRFVSKKTGQRFMRKYLYIWKILKNKKVAAVGIVDHVSGRTMPISYFVIFHNTGSIRNVRIIKYREERGRQITQSWWLRLFIGKHAGSSFVPGKDVDVISGATISVSTVTRGVRKLALLVSQKKDVLFKQ